MRRSLPIALAVLVPALATAATLFPARLQSDGHWLRDPAGRVVLLRGMNYSGLEFGNFPDRPHGPEEADFEQMASWGVNVVRLPIAWRYLEPTPGTFDRHHLRDVVDPVVRFARRHGIAVVLEVHQFQWSPCVGGVGVPAWTCAGMGYPANLLGAFQAQHDFWAGALAPDGQTLVDHLLEIWRRLARHYRGRRHVVGFEFLNEPGDLIAPAGFEHDVLYPFYRRAIATIRRARARQVVFLAPPLLRNLGVPAVIEPVDDDDIVYAPHLYTETAGLPDLAYDGDRAKVTADYALAASEAAAQGAPLWVGEFGGNTAVAGGFLDATEQFLTDSLAEQEAHLVGSAFWAYFPGDNTFSLVTNTGAEKGRLVDIWVRPYPILTAGIPETLAWDPDTHEFLFRFAEDPERSIRDPTVVFVPAARHYPGGFTVETTPGDTAVFDARTSRLLLRRDPQVPVHELRIHPVP
jgi:endoglycosylceramidase